MPVAYGPIGKGVTYVSIECDPEYGGSYPWRQVAECDDVGGCGWRVVLSEYGRPDGKWDTAVSSDDFLPLHQQHLDHRAAILNNTEQCMVCRNSRSDHGVQSHTFMVPSSSPASGESAP